MIAKTKKTFIDPIVLEVKDRYIVWEKGTFMVSSNLRLQKAHEFIYRGWDYCEITKDHVEHNTLSMLPCLSDLAVILERKPYLVRVLNKVSLTPAMLTCCIYNYLLNGQQQFGLQQSGQQSVQSSWISRYMYYLIKIFQLLQEAEVKLIALEK